MIFRINLISSLLIFLYTIFFIQIFRNGYINKILYNDSSLREKINKRLSAVALIIGFFFLVIDMVVYLFIQINFIILVNMTIKLLFYKIFEYYYFYKSKKFERSYLKHFKSKSNLTIFSIALSLILLLLITFLIKYNMIILWCHLLLYVTGTVIIYLRFNYYKFWLYFIKINELTLLFFVFFLNIGFPTIFRYLPVIGLLFVI